MQRDEERLERNQRALEENGLDALVCALPANVLLMTGYCPIVGASLAVMTREGRVVLIAPEDERELAARGWAHEVKTFSPASLDEIEPITEAVQPTLSKVAAELEIKSGARVGYEDEAAHQTATYAAMNLYGASLVHLIESATPHAKLCGAGAMLKRLRAQLTPLELERVRAACAIAKEAFETGAQSLREGLREIDAANLFRAALAAPPSSFASVARCDGFAFCMSGANSAKAFAAYQISTQKRIARGDFALIHCNSYADGFWTDVTRTYSIGEPDGRKLKMYEAVFEARCRALDAIRPRARASDVDRAARAALTERGFGKEFKHGLGHGVGFAAINHNAQPRIHPASDETLERGMVFNVEPAIYFDGFGGLRHCDMVAITDTGAELLTPFHASLAELIITR